MKTCLLILLLSLFSFDALASQMIDGSSQEAYQSTLTEIISSAPTEYRYEIILLLEEKFQDFKKMYPGLASLGTNSGKIRPPEYLALVHGTTLNELVRQARQRLARNVVVKKKKSQQYLAADKSRESTWVKNHYLEIILIP